MTDAAETIESPITVHDNHLDLWNDDGTWRHALDCKNEIEYVFQVPADENGDLLMTMMRGNLVYLGVKMNRKDTDVTKRAATCMMVQNGHTLCVTAPRKTFQEFTDRMLKWVMTEKVHMNWRPANFGATQPALQPS